MHGTSCHIIVEPNMHIGPTVLSPLSSLHTLTRSADPQDPPPNDVVPKTIAPPSQRPLTSEKGTSIGEPSPRRAGRCQSVESYKSKEIARRQSLRLMTYTRSLRLSGGEERKSVVLEIKGKTNEMVQSCSRRIVNECNTNATRQANPCVCHSLDSLLP